MGEPSVLVTGNDRVIISVSSRGRVLFKVSEGILVVEVVGHRKKLSGAIDMGPERSVVAYVA